MQPSERVVLVVKCAQLLTRVFLKCPNLKNGSPTTSILQLKLGVFVSSTEFVSTSADHNLKTRSDSVDDSFDGIIRDNLLSSDQMSLGICALR